ncbi:Spy/CpxP family protein refolding chaperone [Burkholderia cepacia]|uniref:Spy/CpxP family protein refolding chaperone n=1 Tax=Burkholderia cepacia TaxID=292 RepID=UPI001CF55B72|nr:Spy/CpxP family protein refolding chaperone [Burkholderia cepacia]MCA7941998.1 Spy/CpxP family protein refolding chaperone [Burkholderia cepacia]
MTLVLLALPRQIAGAFSVAATVALGAAVFPSLSNAGGSAPDQAPPHIMTVAAQRSIDGRISSLHQRLGITPGQESRWQPVAQVMRDNANAMESLRKARSDHANDMSAMDDLHSYGEVANVHADGVKKLTTAFQPLYDKMSDTQKQNADSIFRGNGRHLIKKQ